MSPIAAVKALIPLASLLLVSCSLITDLKGGGRAPLPGQYDYRFETGGELFTGRLTVTYASRDSIAGSFDVQAEAPGAGTWDGYDPGMQRGAWMDGGSPGARFTDAPPGYEVWALRLLFEDASLISWAGYPVHRIWMEDGSPRCWGGYLLTDLTARPATCSLTPR